MDHRETWRGPPWHEGAVPETDMRSHYVGAYGVYDYDEPVDPEEFAGPGAAPAWRHGAEPREPGVPHAQGGMADPYRQFTGYNERMDLYRGGAQRARPVGPRNYQRSDERILEDICEQLTRNARLDLSDVEVRVEQGVVTLEGSVPTRQQKYRIEDIADDVFAVKDLVNHLRVPRTSASAIHPGHSMLMY
ncbi:BON domain-containing protein [Cupriavidus sp. UYPR2.512]|uniref:BON domain-containing protein n=1 Tax=Cupriavidus sp. UYPR2.512 TaxID=1080187 RepID=UPI0004769545|nr:BON domain-containing protein [Cupriavidus sp. UYPR2.512]UIF90759.1 BON domain-containing protein [Cupriavidus necator]